MLMKTISPYGILYINFTIILVQSFYVVSLAKRYILFKRKINNNNKNNIKQTTQLQKKNNNMHQTLQFA